MMNSFRIKLYTAIFSTVAILVVLAGAFWVVAQRFNFHGDHIVLTQDILESFLVVSNHTNRKVARMGTIVSLGRLGDETEQSANAEALKAALETVETNIERERLFAHTKNIAEHPAHRDSFDEIAALANEIVARGDEIKANVLSEDMERARNNVEDLQKQHLAMRFNDLVDIALREGERESKEARVMANRISELINLFTPMVVIACVLLGIFAAAAVSKSVFRSLHVLQKASVAYGQGDFSHRLEALPEKEFNSLGKAFNQMAKELASAQKKERDYKLELETQVAERTAELVQVNDSLAKSEVNRRKLLSDISHEIRTPLTVIQGESELVLRGEDKSPQEYKNAIDRVREQAMHTTRLVEDLWFIARSEEGYAKLNVTNVNFKKMISKACLDFEVVASKKEVVINLVDTSSDDLVLLGDKKRLQQVLVVVLDNAIRYSHHGGRIEVVLRDDINDVHIQVRDYGIGLTQQDADQVFTRFYRGHSASNHANGTGLGLPVAKAIVDAHGGHISLIANEAKGATAKIKLPKNHNFQMNL